MPNFELHEAARLGREDDCRFLVEEGANVHELDGVSNQASINESINLLINCSGIFMYFDQ
jgi:hypothetical protein